MRQRYDGGRGWRRSTAAAVVAAVALGGALFVPVDASATTQGEAHELVGWGEDMQGVPTSYTAPAGLAIRDLAAGGGYLVGLFSDGSVKIWGERQPDGWTDDALDGTPVQAIAAGIDEVMVLTDDGELRTFGACAEAHWLDTPPELDGKTVVDFALSRQQAVALTDDGKVVVWGAQKGEILDVPAEVADGTATDVAASDGVAAALMTDGGVVRWGYNDAGPFPAAPEGDPYTQVSVGTADTLALTASGHVVQQPQTSFNPVPDALADLTVTRVETSDVTSMALTDDGRVFSWGDPDWPNGDMPSLTGRTATAITSGPGFQFAALTGQLTSTSASVAGDPAVGATLTASSSATPTASPTYHWLRDGSPIDGATGSSYDVTSVDAGHTLAVRAVLKKPGYDTVTVDSSGLSIPASTTPTTMPDTATVSLTGVPRIGWTLTASADTATLPSPLTTTWQWRRDGTPIPGATHATHRVALGDRGHRLTAVAAFSSPGYADGSATSDPTAVVRMPPRSFRVVTDHPRVRRGHAFHVTAGRLARGEAYRVRLGGQTLTTGVATEEGTLHRRLVMPSGTELGQHPLTVVGWRHDRLGAVGMRTLRR